MIKLAIFGLFVLQMCHIVNANQSTSLVCAHLMENITGPVLTPNTSTFDAETRNYWDVRSNLRPACIVFPRSATEVSTAMRILHETETQFAIRGGGHMNYPGSNNIDNGILIALNKLTVLEISSDYQTIAVGPGNKWVDVYAELDKYGLIAIGGRLKTIGVPGLSLIGGFHYFNNKYGWTMDNIVSYDLVLGNGTQLTANATSHSDLFWALKGGANNFGLVTLFRLKTYAIPQISTTIQNFEESHVPAFIEAACALAEDDDASIAAGAVITIQMNTTTKLTSASILGVQEGTESPPSKFSNFSSITSTQTIHNVTTPAQWASKLDTPNQMFRVQFGHHTVAPNVAQITTLYQLWRQAVIEIADVEGLYPTFVLNLMPKSANTVAKMNGIGNVWGLQDDRSWILFQTSTGWARAEDDLRMTAWTKELIGRMHRLNSFAGLASEFLYMGDAGEFQDPFQGFPATNLQRMKDIRDIYDVDGVFRRLNWGGFKLGY